MNEQISDRPRLSRVLIAALAVGIAGAVAAALGAVLDWEAFLPSYLFAFVVWFGIALGGLILSLIDYFAAGRWGVAVRRAAEAAVRTLPLLALLFLPILLGMGRLYEWARPDAIAGDRLLQAKQGYLNVPFFVARAAIFFALWVGLGLLLNRWAVRLGGGPDAALEQRHRRLSVAAIIVVGLTASFAFVDWTMSLEPHWHSAIYPFLLIMGSMLAALAFIVAWAALLGRRPPLAGVMAPRTLNDLGALLLSFVMLWAYVAFSQLLIIWSGNLPELATWYTRRTAGGWQWVSLAIVALEFLIPFLALLSRAVKRSPAALAAISILLLVARVVEVFWLVMPVFRPALRVHWSDVAALLGMGGLWLGFFVWQLGARPLVPRYDPRLEPQGQR